MFYVWNLPAAGAEFKASLRLAPGDAWAWQMYAEYLSAMGADNDMQSAMDTARALDPVSVSVTNNLALVSFVARQYDKAEATARTNAELNVQDALAQHILTLSLLGGGKYAAAVKQAAVEMRALGATPKDIAALDGNHASLVEYFKWYSTYLASRPADKLTAVFLADAYMHLGQAGQAASVLVTAIQRNEVSTLIPFISIWPSLRPLCTVPSYLALTRQLGQVGCLPQ
jgi:tetratricopeptide (TPR) repeat protein